MKKHLHLAVLNLIPALFFAQSVNFSQPSGSPITISTTSLRGITSADLNGDGKKDFVVGNAYSSNINIYLGNGNGQFTTAPGSPMLIGNGVISNAIADFNNDGKPDIATANYNGGNISINLGTGTGSFTPASIPMYATGSLPYWIEAGDFNNDGNMDLVTVAASAGKVYVFLGAGNGTFSQSVGSPYTTGTMPYHVSIGFFNADNIPDFAVANGSSANVSVFIGTGTGSFTIASGSPYSVGSEPRTISVKDINNDSKADLIVANGTGNTISVLLGQATGSFTNAAGSPISIGTYAYQTAIADYDSDGKMDIAVTNNGSNTMIVLLGNGTGGFTQTINSPISVGTQPQAICTNDFNGDGKADLLIGDFGSNKLTVFMNINSVGINNLTNTLQSVSVYPNPSIGNLVIRIDELKPGTEFILYNSLGQQSDKISLTEKETIYNQNNLTKGIYTYSILYQSEVLESGKVLFE
jgi:hypothetical protein